jgi:preprotein translocase subunit YajC
MIPSNAISMILVQEGTPTPTPGTGTPTPGTGGSEGVGASQGSLFDTMMPFMLIGLVLWFLIFAPERKARKKRQAMLDEIKKGDKIVTTGGLHGEVAEVRDHEVVIKAGDSRFVYSRGAIQDIVRPDESKG